MASAFDWFSFDGDSGLASAFDWTSPDDDDDSGPSLQEWVSGRLQVIKSFANKGVRLLSLRKIKRGNISLPSNARHEKHDEETKSTDKITTDSSSAVRIVRYGHPLERHDSKELITSTGSMSENPNRLENQSRGNSDSAVHADSTTLEQNIPDGEESWGSRYEVSLRSTAADTLLEDNRYWTDRRSSIWI
ncbi:MAG: hypothetical protein M1835_006937 [Candelina submexicana]|nr:MAG: hypothetical protein M1835_006937 [Candelina submexicana]